MKGGRKGKGGARRVKVPDTSKRCGKSLKKPKVGLDGTLKMESKERGNETKRKEPFDARDSNGKLRLKVVGGRLGGREKG